MEPASPVERLMFRPVPAWTLLLTVNLAVVALIATAAITRGAAHLGGVGRVALQVAEIPNAIGNWFKGRAPYAEGTFPRLPNGFVRNRAQPLVDPGYMLVTPYDTARRRATVQLIRLSDGAMLHEWLPAVDAINTRSRLNTPLIDLPRDRGTERMRPMHPLLLPDGDLIIHDNTPLSRIDACGRPQWIIDGMFHHSLEVADDGTMWIPYRLHKARVPHVGPSFADEALAQVTPDGRVIHLTRIADILDRNGLSGVWQWRPYVDDPFHLNDIQPVVRTGRYWRRGDLLLSLRHLSLLMLYRPATGRILWSKAGPWAGQHDVSFLDDHRIMVFDNHLANAPGRSRVDGASRLLIHDFATGRTSSPLAVTFRKRGIASVTQGRATPLPGGDVMVEATESGEVQRLAPDGSVRWRYVSADPAGRRLWLSWTRYLDPTDPAVASGVRAATEARCST